jgi:hypothetical protein
MADGRLVSDYRNHCSFNIPTGSQFATKEWMTKNATDIIRLGRERMAQKTGAIYGLDTSVVPPPAIPSPPAVTPPPPSGSYWSRYCADIETLRQRLKNTPETSELCSQPGR